MAKHFTYIRTTIEIKQNVHHNRDSFEHVVVFQFKQGTTSFLNKPYIDILTRTECLYLTIFSNRRHRIHTHYLT